MDTLLRLLPAVVLLLLVSLVGGPAAAKGATDVVVSGPGVAHRHLVHTERPGDVDVYSLADATGIYGIYGPGRFGDRPAVTDAQLGPRYVLTWWQGDQRTVQHAYPFA